MISSARARFAGVSRGGWLVVLAGLGVFFAADDQTSVVAVLPRIIEDVGLAQDQFYRAAWIVNGYILGYVVAMPLIGRFADLYGRGRLFALSLALFALGSAWVALSDDLTLLVIGRAVQAAGAGAVVPVSLAIVAATLAPAQRALGLGAIAAASEAGGLVGPAWGGSIAELVGWRGLFWLNLPLVLPVVYGVWRLSRDENAARAAGQVDLPGALLIGLSLVCLTVALTDDPIDGRPAWQTLALFGGAVLLFGAFLLRQRAAATPLVRLALFARRRMAAGFTVTLLSGGALIVAMVNVPLFTDVVLGGSAIDGGLNLMRLTAGLPVGALLGGWLTARLGPGPVTSLGLALAGAGFIGMAAWELDPSFVELTLPLLAAGLGFGLVIAPVNHAVLDDVAEGERATVAALLTVVRLLGALVGVALLTTRGLSDFYASAARIALDDPRFGDLVLELQVDAFRDSFLVTAAVCFLALLPSLLLGRGGEPQPASGDAMQTDGGR